MSRRKRNPDSLTDKAQTGSLLVAEGSSTCFHRTHKGKTYHYPQILIQTCDKQALEPASRVFGTTIFAGKSTKAVCPPHLFPPDGKGRWIIRATGKKADRVMEKVRPTSPKSS